MNDFVQTGNDGNFSISEFCAWASIGRTKAYGEIRARRLIAKKIGHRMVIPKANARAWRDSLPDLKPVT